jgi:hypothetical protein
MLKMVSAVFPNRMKIATLSFPTIKWGIKPTAVDWSPLPSHFSSALEKSFSSLAEDSVNPCFLIHFSRLLEQRVALRRIS